jgi:hypothetical protein
MRALEREGYEARSINRAAWASEISIATLAGSVDDVQGNSPSEHEPIRRGASAATISSTSWTSSTRCERLASAHSI